MHGHKNLKFDWKYFVGLFSSATYFQLFSEKALGRAQKPMHEFISSCCENHPTCVKRLLAQKIALNTLYIKFYGDSFSDAPLIPHAQTEGLNPFNILRGCGQSHSEFRWIYFTVMRLFYSRMNVRQNPDLVIILYNSVPYINLYFAWYMAVNGHV